MMSMSRRPEARVLALAKRGRSVSQISRNTRLSQDVVVLVLNARGATPSSTAALPGIKGRLSAASASWAKRVGQFFRRVATMEVDI